MSDETETEIYAISMPKWGLAMQEGLLAAWHVAAGATVKKGQEIADIETEKIANAYESPVSGPVRRITLEAGETVPVGALLAVVAEEAISDAQIDEFVAAFNEQFAEVMATRAAEMDTGPQPQMLETRGGELRYLELGDAAGTPLLFVHGFGGDLNNWLFNQPALAESHRTFALDLPGHGGSTKKVAAAGVPELAASVLEFMDAAEIGSAHLVGHSLGGAIAAHIATGAEGRAASATLVCSAGLGPEINAAYIDGFIAANRRKDLKPHVSLLFADPALVTRDLLDDLLKFKRLDGVEAALKAVAGTVFADGRQSLVLRDALASAAVPVQVVWGASDQIVPPAHAAGLPGHIAVHTLDGAGHMVHMEKAAEFNALLERFVSPG